MSEPVKERLYNLLPAIYRLRDSGQGEPMRALLAVIENEVQALKQDIAGMYDDWFIETCSDWVVPYIGDLLGVTGVHPLPQFSLRSYVANTVAYRRRKGTAAVLEQVALDVTGWSACVVEFFRLLSVSQNLSHLRPSNLQIPDLRDTRGLELLGGPFETAAYTADVRSISRRGGRYNLPNIGIFLWRLQSYPLIKVSARRVYPDIITPAFTFDPTGKDAPLFNRPQTEMDISHLAEEINVPGPLRLRPLYDELVALRHGGAAENAQYLGEDAVFSISFVYEGQSGAHDLRPDEMAICDLSMWRVPHGIDPAIKASVDPTKGRLLILVGSEPKEVLVSYSYGFSGDVGAGAYDRTSFLRQYIDTEVDWQAGVSKEEDGEGIFKSLEEALAEWNSQPEGKTGLIAVMDNRTYINSSGAYAIKIPRGSRLLIIAASWPESDDSHAQTKSPRKPSYLSAREVRPHILGDIQVISGDFATGTALAPGELVIDGMMIEGALTVQPSCRLGSLQIAHCTLVQGVPGIKIGDGLSIESNGSGPLGLTVSYTICGEIRMNKGDSLHISDSIIDQEGGTALSADAADALIERSTILGKSSLRSLKASDSIFTGAVNVRDRQNGCVRFCYLPPDSSRQRSFRCQPDLALAEMEAQLPPGEHLSLDERDQTIIRLRPVFTGMRYGDPAYGQLSQACAKEIRTGAEDSSEMGAFCSLLQPQREANLRSALEEYLRFGMEAGIFYVT
jgi:hypothetical protein